MANTKQTGKLIRIPDDLHRELKIRAATSGRTIAAIVAGLVQKWLKGGGK